MLTVEQKREAEKRLNAVVQELKSIVADTGYGYSLMVLPIDDRVTSDCTFIHNYPENTSGILRVPDGDFTNIFDKEVSDDSEQNNKDEDDLLSSEADG